MSRIMLIEDETMLCRTWSAFLEARGHEVQSYFAGSEALAALDTFRPDLVIVDLGLPDMDGIDVVGEVRREHSQARVPILVASGNEDEDVIREAFTEGATDYLVKPVRSSELVAKTSLLLENSQKLQQASLSSEFYPGDVAFGKFRIDRELGRGSYGAVYAAEALETSERVAVKVLSSDSPADRARFLRECYTLSGLRHPGVPRVIDYGQEGEACYLVMEQVEGRDLHNEIRRRGTLDEVSLLFVLRGLAAVLARLESRGVVHRDIKPANVILRRGRVTNPVLIDFGLAKAQSESGVTLPGLMLGTPGYMAPEALSTDDLDARADLFAVGMLARYLLTGREVHPTLHGYLLLQAMASEPVDMDLGVSPATQRLLEDLTQIDPEARIQSASELKVRVAAVFDELRCAAA